MVSLDGISTGGRHDLTNYLAALGKSPNVDSRVVAAEASTNGAAAASAASDSGTVDQRSAVHQIVAEYDLHNITPRELSQLVQRLHDSGAISDADRANFSLLRRDLEAANVDPDESIDLFTFLEDRLDELRGQAEDNESSGTGSEAQELARQTASTLAQYDWLVKLDTIRQLGDATVDQQA
ncbi:MAG: hypothetical protein R3C10_01255 [Pirellulales bacterium]